LVALRCRGIFVRFSCATIRNHVYSCARWKSTKGNDRYVNQIKAAGKHTLHFGDIFLADLRQYREEKN
jgi:hypothetical protein